MALYQRNASKPNEEEMLRDGFELYDGPKLKNITTVKQENKIILAYSLKKIRTKPTEEYSILNPETSSDSPSAKSNGVRLVSAKSSTIQIIKAKGVIRQTHNLVLRWSLKFIEINKEINSITTKARLIS